MNEHVPVDKEQEGVTVSVFSNGRSRAIRIPKEFEFSGKTVVMSKQPDGSILLRTGETSGLVDYLQTAEAWNGGDFLAEVDDEFAPLDEIDLP